MKKLVLLISIIISSTSAYSQTESSIFPLNSETGEIYYSEVIEVNSMPQSDLFLSAKTWFVDAFKSANDVIQLTDKEEGIIIGKGNTDVELGLIQFTFKVLTKDGKYKYEVYNIKYKLLETQFAQPTNDLNNEKPGGGWSLGIGKGRWKKIKTKASNDIQGLIISLKKEMSKSKIENKDDW